MSTQQALQFLEHYTIGEPCFCSNGICCYYATDKESGDRYIAKVISFPAKPSTSDALLLSGAFADLEGVDTYYRDRARDLSRQAAILNALSHSEYFSHISACHTVKRSDIGYDVWLLSPYRPTLSAIFDKGELPLGTALELGITLCRGAQQCREMGFMLSTIRPQNIHITHRGTFQIGAIGFISLSTLQYAPLPAGYNTMYFPPECRDVFAKISPTADVYSIGTVLYQAYNHGRLPDKLTDPPVNADRKISSIIMSACSTVPEDRLLSPTEMLSALEQYSKLAVE